MTELPMLLLSWLAGVGLGALFFGGLWWTVRSRLSSQRPGAWFVGSWLVRTSVAVGGIVLVGAGHWQRLLCCVAGFIAARIAVTRWTRISDDRACRAPEAGDAP